MDAKGPAGEIAGFELPAYDLGLGAIERLEAHPGGAAGCYAMARRCASGDAGLTLAEVLALYEVLWGCSRDDVASMSARAGYLTVSSWAAGALLSLVVSPDDDDEDDDDGRERSGEPGNALPSGG